MSEYNGVGDEHELIRSIAFQFSREEKKCSLLVIINNYVSPMEGKWLMDRLRRFAVKKNGDCGRLPEDSLRK